MNNLTPAEQKAEQRERKAILGSSFAATLILVLALISTAIDFEPGTASKIFALIVLASFVFVFIYVVSWMRSMDEFERQIAANASLVALFSSMFLLPWTYLHKLGFLPEINVYYGYLVIWFIFLISIFYFHNKK